MLSSIGMEIVRYPMDKALVSNQSPQTAVQPRFWFIFSLATFTVLASVLFCFSANPAPPPPWDKSISSARGNARIVIRTCLAGWFPPDLWLALSDGWVPSLRSQPVDRLSLESIEKGSSITFASPAFSYQTYCSSLHEYDLFSLLPEKAGANHRAKRQSWL